MPKLYLGNREVTPAIYSDASVRYSIQRELTSGSLVRPAIPNFIDFSEIDSIGDSVLRYSYCSTSGTTQIPDLSNIKCVYSYGLDHSFSDSAHLTGSIDLGSLEKVYGNGCNYTFYGCSGLTGNVDLSSLNFCNGNSFYEAFYNCTGLNGDVDISSLEYLDNSADFYYAFYGCKNIKSVDLSNLKRTGYRSFRYAFSGCTSLESIDLSSLTISTGNQSLQQAFYNCSSITGNIDLGSLRCISGNDATSNMFYNCNQITGVNLNNLNVLYSGGLALAFPKCTSLTSLSFPHLIGQGLTTSCFNNMLSNCSNVTVHFPSNLESIIENFDSVVAGFGGTNTMVLFDLPSYNTLDWNYFTEAKNSLDYINSWKASSGTTTITFDKVDMSNIKTISGSSTFLQKFSNCVGPLTVDLSSLETITGNYQTCRYMFQGCTGLTDMDLSSLQTITDSSTSTYQSGVCSYMFSNCTNLKTVDLSSLTDINGYYVCNYMFNNCTSLTDIDLSSLSSVINGYGTLERMFYGCTSLETVDLQNLQIVRGTFVCQQMFSGCTNLEAVNLSSLEEMSGANAGQGMFYNCSNLTSVDFSSLEKINNTYTFYYAFQNCTSLTTLSFPALKSTSFGNYADQFSYMLYGCTGVTVHFPSNLQSIMANRSDVRNGFNGTNTTVLFDLPATE